VKVGGHLQALAILAHNPLDRKWSERFGEEKIFHCQESNYAIPSASTSINVPEKLPIGRLVTFLWHS
jgi:hypothetical protein